MRPRYITAVVSQIWATTARSWLIRRKVTPDSRSRSLIRFSACACTDTSSADTGSSATTSFGRVMSARAMAMRWRWPPENSCGMLQRVRSLEADRFERGSYAGAALGAACSAERRQGLGDDFLDPLARIERTVGVLEDHLHMRPQPRAIRAAAIRTASVPRGAPRPNSAGRGQERSAPASICRSPICPRSRTSAPARWRSSTPTSAGRAYLRATGPPPATR